MDDNGCGALFAVGVLLIILVLLSYGMLTSIDAETACINYGVLSGYTTTYEGWENCSILIDGKSLDVNDYVLYLQTGKELDR